MEPARGLYFQQCSRQIAGRRPDYGSIRQPIWHDRRGSDTDLGTVFRLVPPVQGNTSWSKQVLYRFKGTPDGARPGGRLAISKDGTLFGFTSFGGEGRDGTAFSIAPPAPGKTRWKERTLY